MADVVTIQGEDYLFDGHTLINPKVGLPPLTFSKNPIYAPVNPLMGTPETGSTYEGERHRYQAFITLGMPQFAAEAIVDKITDRFLDNEAKLGPWIEAKVYQATEDIPSSHWYQPFDKRVFRIDAEFGSPPVSVEGFGLAVSTLVGLGLVLGILVAVGVIIYQVSHLSPTSKASLLFVALAVLAFVFLKPFQPKENDYG